ncbi:leucine Rich Repeat [Seminavis robusta]|uniref:Leucine Rich Repeat n=1 Tax=Seminavis robusta TaxID=568900 RepID=A0A9N8E4W6_9STRA|nr:leucine Rich Repeat [Seminavis robusta]|eukprot:Sro553_g165230.1 leucine Rich Repeat (506) ;mRNA; f:9761-11278
MTLASSLLLSTSGFLLGWLLLVQLLGLSIATAWSALVEDEWLGVKPPNGTSHAASINLWMEEEASVAWTLEKFVGNLPNDLVAVARTKTVLDDDDDNEWSVVHQEEQPSVSEQVSVGPYQVFLYNYTIDGLLDDTLYRFVVMTRADGLVWVTINTEAGTLYSINGSSMEEEDPTIVVLLYVNQNGTVLRADEEEEDEAMPITQDNASMVDLFGTSYNISSTTSLRLRNQDITGTIPTAIGQLTALDEITLSFNALTGTLPTELGCLTNLVYMSVTYTQLTGGLPTEMAQLTRLQTLYLSRNQLQGVLPGRSLPLSVETLWLDYNQFTGTLPTELGTLTALTWLDLHHNNLTGSLAPALVQSLTALHGLNLNSNQLTGSCLVATWLTALTDLGLGQNQFTGVLPSQLAMLTALRSAWFHGNQFSGSLPTELGLWTHMTTLSVFGNKLLGNIPSELGLWTAVDRLELFDNAFTGSIPTAICDLSLLTLLRVDCDQLSCDCVPCRCMN